MDDATGLLIALAVVAVLAATLLFLVIPEPSQRAIVVDERLDVGVLSFANSSSWPGVEETLSGKVESQLVRADGIDVYARAQLDALLMEHALSQTGLLDPTTAVEIGSLTGVSKLVTGSVYAVDTSSRETSLCVTWQGGECVEEVPATEYSARLRAQIEVIDARTGRIEQSLDLSSSESTTIRSTTFFGGFDSLFADASSSIAEDVVGTLTATYTRELRYGLYTAAEPKRSGFIGDGETNRFSREEDTVHLIVHFLRTRRSEPFDLFWLAPDGTTIAEEADVVSSGEWRLYRLNVEGRQVGRYSVQGILSGTEAFREPFSVVP